MAIWEGSPTAKKAGSVINPPPPAIESTKPPKKHKGQTIKKVQKLTSTNVLRLYNYFAVFFDRNFHVIFNIIQKIFA